MTWLATWAPLIVTLIAWVLFFIFLRNFGSARYLGVQAEHSKHLAEHTALLKRIVTALEKSAGIQP